MSKRNKLGVKTFTKEKEIVNEYKRIIKSMYTDKKVKYVRESETTQEFVDDSINAYIVVIFDKETKEIYEIKEF